jgi:DNA modification methylase
MVRGTDLKPYYDEDGITIYHGDCLEVLPGLTEVDQVLTSPPYNLGQTGGTEWTRLSNGYGTHHDAMPHSAYVEWQKEVLTLCWGALSDTGAIYYNHKPRVKDLGVLLPTELNPGLPLRQIIIWDRTSGFMRQFSCYVPSYEWIMMFAKPNFRITTRDVFDLWRIPPDVNPSHPATFPLTLAHRAIGTTSARLVLDPFMGSGTTLRAAKDLGRRAIGIEIEERYCEIAVQRLAQGVLEFDRG